MIREAPQVDAPEIHGAGWAHSKNGIRDGTHRVRTGALVAARVYRGDRNVMESARGKPRELEGQRLAGRRARRRGCDLGKGGPGTGRGRGSVVDAIGRQIRQRASVNISARSRPANIQDPGSSRSCRQEDSAQCQTETEKPPAGRTKEKSGPRGVYLNRGRKCVKTRLGFSTSTGSSKRDSCQWLWLLPAGAQHPASQYRR